MTKVCGVLILAFVILSTANIIESTQTKLPITLQNVLRKYGKQSEVSDVENALRAKVAKLMPLLDDKKNDVKESNENDIFWDSDIIRNGNLNPVSKRYKKLRGQIEKLLKIESVSDETRKAVTNALDEITADVMSTECLWKKKIKDNDNLRTTDQTEVIMKHIQQKWTKIFNQYPVEHIGLNDTARKTFAILTGLREFIFDVHDEYKRLENRYDMKCEIVNKSKKINASKQLRENGSSSGECHVQVCSAEILNFMTDFHKQLKETYSDIFNNYIEMYQKEVKRDERRREYYLEDSFENHMNQLEAHVEKKIENVFLQSVEPLEFTSNYTLSTINSVTHFIDKIIHDTLKQIDKSISRKLKKLPPKLRLTVREDLQTSAGIELGNLKQEFKNKVCTVFQTCNGVATWRKYNKRHGDYVDPNSIHLKLKLGFDKHPIKDIINLLGRKIDNAFNGHETNAHEFEDSNKDHARKDFGYEVNQTQPFNGDIYTHLNVTRTTLREYVERGTTKVTETASSVNTDATISHFSMEGNKSLLL